MKYKLCEELGRGTYGIVFRAECPGQEDCAIKVLNLQAFPESSWDVLRKRFDREVRYQHEISHPNVVPVIDYDLEANPPWFAMPLAVGSLADDLDADHTLGGAPQQPLFEIIAGLEALHQKGFTHRDLKPANVLKFNTEEGDVTFKISDFGLTTPGAGQTTTLTASNMAGGTPLYRAPECANNFRRATPQADVYSVGAILHDVFGGGMTRSPHMELTVPGVLGPIVEKCTKSNVRRRYRSIAALREELFDVLKQENVEFYSQEEEEIVSLLRGNDELSDEQWDRAFNLIDDNADRNRSNYNIMRAISRQHIISLFESAPDMAMALGEIYADFAHYPYFDFDYCDIVSDKAQIFFDQGDLQLKAYIAIAMLQLGTSHNRWRVEHQFMRMVANDIDDALAERVVVEMKVRRVNFVRQFRHLEKSINASRDQLHPVVRAHLVEQE